MTVNINDLKDSRNDNLIIDNSGNLGIGTLTPSQKLYVNGKINIQGAVISKASFIGTIVYFARNTAPEGWLKCNGANISRTVYSELFNAIGTTFGSGDGSTFGLPDLRGEFIRIWDNGRGIDNGRAFGVSQGDSTKRPNTNFTTDNPGNHTHSYTRAVNYFGCEDTPQDLTVAAETPGDNTGFAGAHIHSVTGGGDSETRPINISLLACIKY